MKKIKAKHIQRLMQKRYFVNCEAFTNHLATLVLAAIYNLQLENRSVSQSADVDVALQEHEHSAQTMIFARSPPPLQIKQ